MGTTMRTRAPMHQWSISHRAVTRAPRTFSCEIASTYGAATRTQLSVKAIGAP